MKTTVIKTKSGEKWEGALWHFRPEHGYICFQLCGRVDPPGELWRWKRFKLDEMESCVTLNVMLHPGVVGNDDELARAKKHLAEMKEFGWKPNEDDAPEDQKED